MLDEAHILLERGREMYSAPLVKETFLELKREIKQTVMSEMEEIAHKSELPGQLSLEMMELSADVSEGDTEAVAVENVSVSDEDALYENGNEDDSVYVRGKKHRIRGGKSILVREGYGELMIHQLESCNKELLAMKRECENYRIVEDIDGFVHRLMRLYATMGDYLEEQEYTQLGEDGSFLLKLFCVNPRENLKECMLRGRSTILFSATFLPIQYYKGLLGGEAEDYEVYAKSVFHPEKRALLIANDVTSKYTRRSREEYFKIARYIDEIVKNSHGNYMVFCPSYAFLQTIYDIYIENFADEEKECVMQQDYMSEAEREEFLARFRGNEDFDLQAEIAMEIEEEEHTLIGFCVLGGIFSEGIDLKHDSLIGVIIVGTGLPIVCNEREILKNYFDDNDENGFDYSYRYPGMNKVLQAAGRVIRTAQDVGIIALLDERFLQFSYRRMFPREWESFEAVSVDTVAKRVERFWDSWL